MQSGWTRRQALCGVTLVAWGALGVTSITPVGANRAPRLYVFVPTIVRARALAPMIEAAMNGVEVTVFGRFADFMSAVTSLKPEAALSLTEGLAAVGLHPDIQGAGSTGTKEPYIVLTNDRNLRVNELARSTLGVVDVVGRRALPGLVRDLLGLDSPPNVRRVLTVADLLPLLSLELANGIVLPERFLSEFRANTRLDLRVLRPERAALGRAAVAFPSGRANSLIRNGMRRLSHEARRALGIDRWEDVR